MASTTIDKKPFYLNLTVLTLLTASVFAGGIKFGQQGSLLSEIAKKLDRLADTVDAQAAQVGLNNRTIAVMDSRLASLERRISALESKVYK